MNKIIDSILVIHIEVNMKTIAIASGKGGVGKSTVTTQLASILANNGYKVGVIDADIYGPCQFGLLNNDAKDLSTTELQLTPDNKIIPGYSQTHQVYYIAVNNLVADSEESPMLWRAPMATRLIREFIERVAWPELDFLFIDLPPGTGDIQITIAQLAKLDGAIIVTTPQKVAYSIAAKAVQMFKKVNIPLIGIIENMSGYICTNCNHENHIFNNQNNLMAGGNILANKYSTDVLGKIPLDPNLISLSDAGLSVVSLDNTSPTKNNYLQIIEKLLIKLFTDTQLNNLDSSKLQYKLQGKQLELVDPINNKLTTISAYDLRLKCPCALCIEETTGRKLINKNLISPDISIINIHEVGNYGLRVMFSDGHNTGIYTVQNSF